MKFKCEFSLIISQLKCVFSLAKLFVFAQVLKKLEIEDEQASLAAVSSPSSSSPPVYVASPLHRLALHIEVNTLSVLALLTARVRDARRRRAIKLVAFHNHVAKVR